MKASENQILRFINGSDKNFIIPVYQRPYSWKKENCVQLIKDLTDVYKRGYESHFFGSIVFVSQNNGVCEEYTIIDGQQRITTVSLLLLAIRNYILSHPEITVSNIKPEKIYNSYLIDEYAEDEKKLKLKLVQGDDDAYDALLSGKAPIENTSITSNYSYFYDEISKLGIEEIKGLYDAITKLDIVSISLQPQNGDNPQMIFESLNSTGLDLEPADKIRNFVLMGLKNKQQEKFYRTYWEPLENTVDRNEMNKFIRYYLDVKTRKLINEKKLYLEFKYYQQNSGISVESILKDMLEFAEYYHTISNPCDNRKPYTQILQRINRLDVKTCIPLMMDLFKALNDSDISEGELCDALNIIENYIVRREICSLPTNALNKVFVQMGADIERDIDTDNISYFEAFRYEILKRTGKSRFPSDHDFEDKFTTYDLYNTKSAMKKYILEMLENFNNREQVAVDKLVSDGTLTIEHIMPQTLSEEWKNQLGSNGELIHTKYVDTIGNLTLTAYNSDYSNSSFQVKKTMPGKGFLESKLSLNEFVKKCDTWGEKEIQKRAKLLYEKAFKIWWIPKSSDRTEEKDEWIDWDEDYDFTNKRIGQITVLDSVIKTLDMTDAYRKIHETLYELEPTIYHSHQMSWFSESKKKLRRAHQIGRNAYIETNKNSREKVSTIKFMAELFNLNSYDIRFLIQEKQDRLELNIDDESTYRNVTVGKLAYEFIARLLKSNAIDADEISKLKTKEYTKQLFSGVDYPVLADNRNANRGNSSHIRYRKKPLVYEGKEIYVTTQWFDKNRDDVIKWYKSHII